MNTIKKVALIALICAVVSCGGEGEQKEEKESVKIGAKKTTSKKDANVVNLALSGNDLMQYDKKEMRVKAGQTVKLTFRHTGKIEKKVMGHNFVLLEAGTEVNAFATKAAAAGESQDWIPEGTDQVIVHSKMLGGGESTTITFEAPAAGTYDYICSFPGHAGLMKGKFIVE